jgi:DNA-binding GntR family transcriptional regulator
MSSRPIPEDASLSASGKAYAEIRRMIVDGVLAEGQPVRQDEIAARLGISKIPVREALMRLQAENWVSARRNAGVVVAPLTRMDCLEMLDIRIGLECRALELAVPNMASSDFARAGELLDRYASAGTKRERSDLNLAFHQALYAAANRPRLVATAWNAQERMGRLIRLRVSAAAEHERSIEQHRAILDACGEGDAREAVRLLRKHIEQTQREVMAYFRSIENDE